ncbi:MAG TPA: cytochrome c3 family protein [Pseudolabrys sp.]|nr:cytochrome c3 family protein [Pseudolabrys sp.]
MTQIFSPAADTWMRLFIVGGLALTAGALAASIGFARSDYYTQSRIVPHQPVPFSHQHHVSGLGIDCRYCHTSVESSAHAGLPPTETCMTCHSQIWTNASILAPERKSLIENQSITWHRVARLPEYVYFRHDIHIAKGVGCVTCHGRVDRMPLTYRAIPLTMGFCLDCHRDPGPNLRPRDRVTDMNWRPSDTSRQAAAERVAHAGIRLGEITHCYVCHR